MHLAAELGGILILTAALVALILNLPLIGNVRRISATTGRALHVMRARGVSDHWKERAMMSYSGITLMATLGLIAALAVLAVTAWVLIAGLGMLIPGFAAMVFSPWGIAQMTLIAAVMMVVRNRVAHVL